MMIGILTLTSLRRMGLRIALPDASLGESDSGAWMTTCSESSGTLGLALTEQHVFWIVHAILAGLVLSEIAKGVLRAIDYRRGV